ncbi:MAG TPA: hypothetical protein VMJ32_18360 [Pirellulales bacterium]|nr:hypothetical protein [Pirellulales bacterium]
MFAQRGETSSKKQPLGRESAGKMLAKHTLKRPLDSVVGGQFSVISWNHWGEDTRRDFTALVLAALTYGTKT